MQSVDHLPLLFFATGSVLMPSLRVAVLRRARLQTNVCFVLWRACISNVALFMIFSYFFVLRLLKWKSVCVCVCVCLCACVLVCVHGHLQQCTSSHSKQVSLDVSLLSHS